MIMLVSKKPCVNHAGFFLARELDCNFVIYAVYFWKDKSMETGLNKLMEEIALKKILRKYPEAADYKTLIKFRHSENKISIELDLLPPDLAKQIDELFQ